jgi:DNA-binding IclR family transcriptional regulator
MSAEIRPLRVAGASRKVRERKGIQSVEIGVRVLDALSAATGALPLREIGRLTGLSASQAHRYLASFLKSGLVRQDPTTGYYDLGSRALRWGLAAMSRIDEVEFAAEALKRLSTNFDVTGIVSIWGERGPTCIRMQRGSSLIGTDLGLGTIFPILGSATGNVFLAFLPESLTAPLVRRELESARERGAPANAKGVSEIAAKVRQRGYARAQGHFLNNISAISAPVFDFQRELVAAITLIVRREHLAKAEARLTSALLAETRGLSKALGG